MEEKILRIKSWLEGKREPPFVLEIRPTNNCNLDCLSCKARGKERFVPNEEVISDEEYVKMINDAGKMGVKFIQIVGGGEPLMRRNATFSMMKAIKKFGMEGFLVTNGTLFDEEIVKELIKVEFDSIFFSLDGPDKETNDFLRGRGSFNKTINSLELFSYWKKKLNKNKPRITLGPVLSSKNFDKIEKFVELAKKFDVEEITLQPIMVPDNNLGRLLKLSKEQKLKCRDFLKRGLSLAKDYGIHTNFEELDDSLIEKSTEIEQVIKNDSDKHKHKFLITPCFEPFFFISIHANGKAYPCCIDDDKLNFGNIKQDSLSEIWFGKPFDSFRNNILNRALSSKCKECCGTLVMENREIREKLSKLLT